MHLSPTPWRWSKPAPDPAGARVELVETGGDEPADPTELRPATPSKWRRRLRAVVAGLTWAYLVLALGLWVFVRAAGDRWWLSEFILLGPRWVFALPAGLLLPAVLLIRRRSFWVLAAGIGFVAGPVMGLNIPWHRLVAGDDPGFRIRVMTCNTHGAAIDPVRMAALIDASNPDVVAMQEWGGDPAWPALGSGQWQVLTDAELRVQSRYPLRRVDGIMRNGMGWGRGNAIAYELQTPVGPVRLLNLHLASPHDALRLAVRLKSEGPAQVEENTQQRLRQAAEVAAAARLAGPTAILCGDFNMTCDSEGYRWNLAALQDAFSAGGWGFGWTYFHQGTKVRIDHILSGANWDCRKCWVGPPVGSPHRPLIADLTWKGG